MLAPHASPLEAHLLPYLIRCDALRSLYDATGYKAAVRDYCGCADEAHGYSVAPVEDVLGVELRRDVNPCGPDRLL